MKVTIENDGATIFETDGENTLAPLDQGERSRVFYALTEALAAIAGIMPRLDIPATADATDEHSAPSARDRRGHMPENIVHLPRRPGSQAETPRS